MNYDSFGKRYHCPDRHRHAISTPPALQLRFAPNGFSLSQGPVAVIFILRKHVARTDSEFSVTAERDESPCP